MLGRSYEAENCSAARALELAGERWSLLIIRDALFRGITRFSDFQRSLGVAPNILAARLDGFVSAGVMTRRPGPGPGGAGQPGRDRQPEYVLTEKGRDFGPVIMALTAWGDRWAAPQGPPVVYQHESCGRAVSQPVRCPACGPVADPRLIAARPGPGTRSPVS